MTLAVVSATMVSLAIGLTEMRESGRLKRVRSTPLPTWAFVAGRVGNSIVTSADDGRAGHVDRPLPLRGQDPDSHDPGARRDAARRRRAFSCLGFALTAVIPSEEAAPPITNFTVLPLYFLSGVFIPETEIPDGVLAVADVFPIRPFFEALLTGFDPATTGAGFEWGHLLVVAAWGVAGLAIAAKTFSWAPRRG